MTSVEEILRSLVREELSEAEHVEVHKEGKGIIFSARLLAHKCLADGCDETVSVGAPFCALHTEIVYGVVIGPTTIPNCSFSGLFAARDFRKGEKIIPYFHLCQVSNEKSRASVGEDFASCSAAPLEYDAYAIDSTHSALLYRCAASLANTQLRVRKGQIDQMVGKCVAEKCNMVFAQGPEDETKYYEATRDIKKGEELFGDYGRQRCEYFDYHTATLPAPVPRGSSQSRQGPAKRAKGNH